MIMKANKQIGFIYKDNESIDKILKDGNVVFERGFLRERTTTTLPITFGGVGKDLKDYKVYGNTVQSKLPSGYTQVDYIESSGTQYIDTGVNTDINLDVKVDMQYTDINASSNNTNFGAIYHSGSVYYRYHINKTAGGSLQAFILSSSNSLSIASYSVLRHSYYIKARERKVYYDNQELSLPESSQTDTLLNFWLFGRNSNESNLIFYNSSKLYSCQMHYNGILVRDFIPCYRNSDNEVGLYDLVNNVFYTNQGTGVFTYGSVAPTPDAPIDMVSCGDLITDSQDEHYGKYKIPVNVNNVITNIYLDEPLRKIDGYSDYIDFINGKVVRNIDEVVLDSDMGWSISHILNTNIVERFRGNLDNAATPNLSYCNMFINRNKNMPAGDYECVLLNMQAQYSRIYISIDKSRIGNATLNEFKSWLSSNNVTVDYILATPTEESIELPNIPTIDGNNTLNIETEITPSQVYIKYKSSE